MTVFTNDVPHIWDPSSLAPEEAFTRLVEGNRRFLAGEGSASVFCREHAETVQQPFAIVLGCSDSRMPVEIVFDQGFGDLFVVRIAGNIAAPSVIGSIEFAVSQFGTRLVVVLGHSHCGAVGATIDAITTGDGPTSKNIRAITDRIAPHIEGLVQRPIRDEADRRGIVDEAIRANVRATANHLRHGSRLLEELVLAERIVVVTAEYELESGLVHFFGDRPGTAAHQDR